MAKTTRLSQTQTEPCVASKSCRRGSPPRPVSDARVTAVKHCGDNYVIKTAEGAGSTYGEQNIRLKIDGTETCPPSGVGVVLGAGMQGDRYSVILASVADLESLVSEFCETQ
jgi:cytochrome c